ncbi:MerR family transcriptional regulator [Streptomyces sp. LaPpAH-108]|uniref:MerR family transcriptional regulator n=1 Tax=Streptomyces sp. LaPpAH-108 TaxID=1155714 RepID=UPI000378E779|nr:MerR family transcriptional regulator [Streptomyces sp. LaPpAH-108]
MELLTIGAFARASRLSPKALRLYDELELLRPARVDPGTGYRYYAVSQLERARLVAWLRRLGMPLAGIRAVSALEGADAAREVRAYWARVEAETAARRDLAAFLVDQLTAESGRDHTDMLELRYAARADRGHVRTVNQDTVYAGRRLLAVADGFGPAGAPASGAAVDALRFLDKPQEPHAGSVLNLLEDAVRGASEAIAALANGIDGIDGADSGATLTALLWTGSRLALVHIGDSRAYLLRDGELFRVTHDHSVVQSLLDEGRLTPEEAAVHPQRTLLLKALGGATVPLPDLRLQEARAGDRYLLCSDGLTGVVPDERIARLLAAAPEPAAAVEMLIGAANAAGGPDNIGCVVADVVPGAERAG